MYVVTIAYKGSDTVTRSEEMTANALAAYIADIRMSDVKSYTVEEVTALQSMVHKLDNPRPNSRGYIAPLSDVKGILNELTDLLTCNIWYTEQEGNMLGVEIKIGFHLDRTEL